MRYYNSSRLLMLFSVLLLCHAATVTRGRNSSDSHRHLKDPLAVSVEETDSDETFQPTTLSTSSIDAIIKAMDPPPNCDSLDSKSLYDESEEQRHNRLECFLWNLKFAIPEQSFEKGLLKITVHDMLCTNFRLHGLHSNSSITSLMDPHSNELNDWSALQVSVQRVSATCQGRYHSTPGLAGNVLATVSQSSPDSQALELRVGIRGEESSYNQDSGASVKLPVSFETKSCETHMGCQEIHFSGSISARMIQLFSGTIGSYITQALQEQVCPLMTKLADPIVTAYLKEFDDLIRPYLEDEGALKDTRDHQSALASTDYLSNDEDKATNLVEFPVVSSTLSFLNEQLRYHLQTGWIPLPPPTFQEGNFRRMSQDCIDSFRGISGWIISILGRRPRIPLPQNLQRIVFPIPNEVGVNGTIALDIPEVVVEGLDEMDALQVFAPSRSMDLNTKIVSEKGFSVVLPIKMEIRWPTLQEINVSARPTLVESFQLTINVTQIDASLSSLIDVIDWESTSLLQIVDVVQNYVNSGNLRDLACLLRTLQNVQLAEEGSFVVHNILIDAIQISRDKKKVPDGSLEADLDHMINAVLDLFLADYADLWTHLVRGLVRGPGSSSLNQYVESWIKRHSQMDEDTSNNGRCPSASRSPGQWVNFTKFEILNTFNRFLDHSHTKKSLNDFLQCLAESIEEAVDGVDDSIEYHLGHRDEYIESNDFIGGFVSMLVDNAIVTNSNLDIPRALSDILVGNMNIFVESGKAFWIQGDNFETKVTLSEIELRNWGSIQRLQIMRPAGDTSLVSALAFGTKASSESIEDKSVTLSSSMKPPEIVLVVEINGSEISGQINLSLFGSLLASTEVNVDYDLNRLENLTVSRLLDEASCAFLPAMQIRFMPETTDVAFGEYFGANLTANIDGRNFSLSTNDFPTFLAVSNYALSWSQEFTRTAVNYVLEKLTESSTYECPGVVSPDNKNDDSKGHDEKQIYWLWRDSTALWLLLSLAMLMQGGLIFVYNSKYQAEVVQDTIPASDDGIEATSRTTPMLSSYQELMSHPSSETAEQCNDVKQKNSIDDHIIHDICEEWNEEEEPQGILEDQLVDEFQESNVSLFDSDKIPEIVKYLVPIMIIGTIVLFICSNLSVGATVDLSVELGQRSIGIPGLFQFSLANTVSEMYMAGIYPLLFLVLCFSGLWPYVKLLCMLYSWMIPCGDQHEQEKRLLTLDAMGKYSLVDNYVLILFVVAFRFHLEIVDNLGIDVYVTPIYGFFSFLFATCLSLALGHAVLFFHRETMHGHDDDVDSLNKSLILNHGFKVRNENSRERLSRLAQGLLLLSLFATFGFLIWGFAQKSFTFEIGGLAGIMLGEDVRKTSYSVISLGAALPSSVEDPESPSIVFLQGIFFFFTVVTPILCLILILILMLMPLTLKWQRYLLVAAEIANSWSAVEVFLLSILAALFQISTFASFMIGNKCDEINILADKIFDEKDTICFMVDASVDSNCWYLLVGALANIVLVTFCLGFAETAVDEKVESSRRANESPSGSMEQSSNRKRHDLTLIQKMVENPFVRCFMFASVTGSFTASEEEEFEPFVEQEEGREIDSA